MYNPDDNHIFETIRKESKFCSICGNKLDLDAFRDWHLPFCKKCRMKLNSRLLKESIKKTRLK